MGLEVYKEVDVAAAAAAAVIVVVVVDDDDVTDYNAVEIHYLKGVGFVVSFHSLTN